MDGQYKHLDAEERDVIFAEHRRGSSLRQIGRLMGRHHGIIGRELMRGAVTCGYGASGPRCGAAPIHDL